MRIDIKAAELRRAVEWFEIHYGDEDSDLKDIFLEGETDLHAIALRIHEQIARDHEMLAGIKERIATIRERESRIKARASASKEAIGALMRTAGVTKLELPEITYSVRYGKPGIEVADPEAVPDEFCDFKRVPRKADNNAAFDPDGELPNWLTRKAPHDIVTGRTA